MRYTHSLKLSKRYERRHVLVLIVLFAIVGGGLFSLAAVTGTDLEVFIINLIASTLRIIAAYFISLALALVLALLVTHSKRLETFLFPILDVMQSFPSFAILPLALVLFGSGSITAILFLVLTMIWPILFSIITGLRGIRPDLEEAVEVFGARGWKKLRYFTLPMTVPGIVAGSIVAWGEGWEAIVGAELIGISTGIGAYLFHVSETGSRSLLMFGIVLLMFVIFTVNKLTWIPLLKYAARYHQDS